MFLSIPKVLIHSLSLERENLDPRENELELKKGAEGFHILSAADPEQHSYCVVTRDPFTELKIFLATSLW